METKGFFQFEIIMHVSVYSFRFIWIPTLAAYRRQILTSNVDPRAIRAEL